MLNVSSAASPCSTAHVDGNVSAAHNHGSSVHFVILVICNGSQEVYRSHNALSLLSGDSGLASALASDRNVESLVALFPELGNRNVLSHFNSSFDFNAHFLHHVDFCLNNVFFELEAWNSVNEHTSGNLVFLENSRAIAFFRQVERARKSSRASADNRDFLLKLAPVRRNNFFWDKPCRRVQIFLSDEFLYFVNGNRFVNRSAGTCRLAPLVADSPANRRERIFFLDKGKGFRVAAFARHFQITLNSDVGRAGSLARCSSG